MSTTKKPYRTPIINLSDIIGGKMSPHDPELEEAILGAIMLSPYAIYKVMDLLTPASFYSTAHQHVYQAILDLFKKGHKADILHVCDQLTKNGTLDIVGGRVAVMRMTNNVVSDTKIETHAKLIYEHHLRRELAKLCIADLSRSYDLTVDVFDLMEEHHRQFTRLDARTDEESVEMADILIKLQQKMERGAASNGMVGIPTGHPSLDECLGGFQFGNLFLSASRTRHGKSALAVARMHFISKIKNPDHDPDDPRSHWSLYPGALFSIEMPQTQVASRLLSTELRDMGHYIYYTNIEKGLLLDHERPLVDQAMQQLAKRNLYIDPAIGLSSTKLRSRIMRFTREMGIRYAIVDYIQEMHGDPTISGNVPEQIRRNARDMKSIAKEEDIAMLVLSQIDRGTEKGTPRAPGLADLKGSGGLEESADVVELLYRPEVNDPNPQDELTGESLRGILQCEIAKNKQGPTMKIKMPFDVTTSSFGNFDAVISHTVEKYMEHKKDQYFSLD